MSRNVTLEQWKQRLKAAVEPFGGTIQPGGREARWESRPRGYVVTIAPRIEGGRLGVLVPTLRIGGAHAIGSAPTVRRQLQAGIDVIDAAQGAMCELGDLVVWRRDCPCDFCRGRGRHGSAPCSACGGAGVLNDEPDADTAEVQDG